MTPQYVIGMDVGTTSAKALAVSVDGAILHTASAALNTVSVGLQGREQVPAEVLAAIKECLQQTVSSQFGRLLGICFSTAMHSLLAVDAWGNALTNAYVWSDNRAHAQVAANRDWGLQIYPQTGLPFHPMSPLAKLLWLRQTQPDLFAKAYKFVSLKEYILFHLTGKWVIDWSMAGATGLFDLHTRTWLPTALEAVGLLPEQLSIPVSPFYPLLFAPSAAAELSISPGVSIFPGGSDGCLANVGVGALSEGVWAVTVGTSGAIRGAATKPMLDPEGRLFCFLIDENLYIVGGPVNNGGIVLQWFAEQVLGADSAEIPNLLAEAEQVPIGAEGLLCLPYLQGERAPLWDSSAKGAFIGLGIHHHRAHLVRAMLEAIVFSLRHTAEVLEAKLGKPRVLLMSGGLGQADFWVQMMADCFQTPIQITSTLENSALGAALLGLKGLGLLPDYQLIGQWFPPVRTYQPRSENQAAYDRHFVLYKQAYWAMRETVQGLRDVQ